jgi:hypothetical protein
MTNAVHEATIADLNSQIAEANGQLNAHLVSGDAAGATKARRKVANLSIELDAAQKAADVSLAKSQADAAAAIDADTHDIGIAAGADLRALLAKHGVADHLVHDDTQFMHHARNIAVANHELNAASEAFGDLQAKADRVASALNSAVQRHAKLKANRTPGDTAGAADMYALSLDIESLTAIHAEALLKLDTVDVATPRAAIAHARALLTETKNLAVREALFAHAQQAEVAFMASIRSLVGFVRGSGVTPMERTASVFSIYRLSDDLDWLNRTGALR